MLDVVRNGQDMAFYCVLCNCLSPVRDPSEEKIILLVLPECEQICLIFFFGIARRLSHPNFAAHERKRLDKMPREALLSALFSRVRLDKFRQQTSKTVTIVAAPLQQ